MPPASCRARVSRGTEVGGAGDWESHETSPNDCLARPGLGCWDLRQLPGPRNSVSQGDCRAAAPTVSLILREDHLGGWLGQPLHERLYVRWPLRRYSLIPNHVWSHEVHLSGHLTCICSYCLGVDLPTLSCLHLFPHQPLTKHPGGLAGPSPPLR